MSFDQELQLMADILSDYLREKGISLANSPPYRYYSHPRKLFRYCWNTEPLMASEQTKGKKWAAFIYKSKSDGLQLIKTRYFNKRSSAKTCAYKWNLLAKKKYEAGKVTRSTLS